LSKGIRFRIYGSKLKLREVLEIQIFDLAIIKTDTSSLQKSTLYFGGSSGHKIYLKNVGWKDDVMFFGLSHHETSSTFRINLAISFLASGLNANSFIPIDFAFPSEIIVE